MKWGSALAGSGPHLHPRGHSPTPLARVVLKATSFLHFLPHARCTGALTVHGKFLGGFCASFLLRRLGMFEGMT